ncbi:MAG: response regulator [Acidobacteriota bacterium]
MKSLLLADDSMTIQKVVELSFTDEDVVVTSVGNGRAALDSFWASRQDIVLADIVMPGEDGYEVCRQIKEKSPGTPVVLLVGTFESFDEEQAASCRCDASLTKPFETSKLIGLVKDLLAKADQFPSEATTNTEQQRASAPVPSAQSHAPKRLSILSIGVDDITVALTRLERRVMLSDDLSPSQQAVSAPAAQPAPAPSAPPETVVQALPADQPAAESPQQADGTEKLVHEIMSRLAPTISEEIRKVMLLRK